MEHALFGTLTYNPDEQAWNAYRPLAHFARFGVRPASAEEPMGEEEQRELLDEMQGALDQLKDRIREKYGPEVDELFKAMDEEIAAMEDDGADDSPLFDEEQEAELERRDAKDRRDEHHRREGLFPVNVPDPKREGPSPEQEAAFRYLLEHEGEVCRDVAAALFRSYEQYYADEHWRDLCSMPAVASPEGLTAAAHLLSLEVQRHYRDGFSYLVFPVQCDWEQEHGMYVVYHPSRGAEWTTADGLYDLLDAEGGGDEDEGEVPGNQELFDALMRGDDRRVRELVAQGHDINDVGEDDPYPPLCAAVEQADVGLVRRLLAIGADPNLKDFENQTPLQRARRMLKDLTPKKGDKLMEAMMAMARKANPGVFEDHRAKLEEIVRLLEAAGAK
ncbi:MAG TPA: hypothetical protein VIL46_05030 [Gemmataceae bacterium]